MKVRAELSKIAGLRASAAGFELVARGGECCVLLPPAVVAALVAVRQVRAYKISKRFDCDISALCAGLAATLGMVAVAGSGSVLGRRGAEE